MRHTVAFSDVHLSEAEPGDGLWMRYRQRAYSPQGEIAAMLEAVRTRIGRDELTVVLNGDIFDFDAPRVVGNESRFHDLPRSAEHAVPAIAAILEDHPVFVAALGRRLAEGHTVVFISGNHDVQLTLPEVRAIVAARLVDAALAIRAEDPAHVRFATRAALEQRVLFRAWFHRTPDGIVIEHGNEYDPYCSWRYPMAPFGREQRVIHPNLGSLSARLLVSRMGYFNPHVDASYMLTAWGYIRHWAKYYLFSRRSLAAAWAVGAVRTLVELWRLRVPERRSERRANITAAARETGVPVKIVARHARLIAKPVEERLGRVARELWLDRVGMAMAAAAFAALWLALAPASAWFVSLLGLVLFLGYELMVPKLPLEANWSRVGRHARKVGKVHRARAVVFGHTHYPEGSWEGGAFFGNTGSWSAAYLDEACTKPANDERPFVWLMSEPVSGRLEGGLFGWREGKILPRGVAEGTVVPEPREPSAPRSERAPVAIPMVDPRRFAGVEPSESAVAALEAAGPKSVVDPSREAR